MAVVNAVFPSHYPSGEARPLTAQAIWSIARDVRRQICSGLWAKPLTAEMMISRVSTLVTNGIRFTPIWDCRNQLHDDEGIAVAGACEYDSDSPDNIYLSLNPNLIDGCPELAASTAAHELGHAIFDGPASVISCRRITRHVIHDEMHFAAPTAKKEEYWSEYRANEFMGGLLAPPDLLHRSMVIRARVFGVALTNGQEHYGKPGYPVIDGQKWKRGEQGLLIDDLAAMFGVSATFIWVRLQKYRLVTTLELGRT